MKIAIGQIGTDADKTANFALVAQAVITAAMNHARLILFPEATMRAFGTGRLDEIAEPLDGPFVSALAGLAKNYNIAIVVGWYVPTSRPACGERKNHQSCVQHHRCDLSRRHGRPLRQDPHL